MTIFLVLGVLFAVAEGALLPTVTSNVVTATEANNQLQAALTPLNNELSNYSTQIKNCTTQSCVSNQNHMAANAFNTFAAQVRAISMPDAQTTADAQNLASSAEHVAGIYSQLAAATTQGQYESIASGLQPAVDQVQQNYTTLTNDLHNS